MANESGLMPTFSYGIGSTQQARIGKNFNEAITAMTLNKVYEGQYGQDANGRIYGDVEPISGGNKLKFFADGSITPAVNGTLEGSEVLLMHMDDNVEDALGNHVVTAVGSPTYVNGKFDKAISLNGTDQYCTIPENSDFDITSQIGSWTIDYWINPVSFASYSHYTVSIGDAEYDSFIHAIDTSSNPKFLVSYNGSSFTQYTFNDLTVSTSAWQHIALVCNEGTVSCYLDGTASSTTVALTGDLNITTKRVVLAGSYDASNNYNGLMDELRITNRSALWTANFTPPISPYIVGVNATYGENIYQIAEYDSYTSSETDVVLIGSGVGVGLSGVFSYSL